MITANVIHRVFRISTGTSSGTAFTIDVNGREYLITAKHVVENLAGTTSLDIYSNTRWVSLAVEVVGHAQGEIDISVLAAHQQLTRPGLPLEPTSAGVVYGQDAYFLGFPYNIVPRYIFEAGGYPLPLVKRATVSSFDQSEFLLDGHNNPGFSGGPVVFQPPGKTEFRVAAVVSGFQAVPAPIFANDVEETNLSYEYNTGIIVAHSIDHALELINARP